MASTYHVNDEQAAVFLAALIIENGKNGKKPLRVSFDSIRKAGQAAGIKARDFFPNGVHEVEFKLVN